SSAAIPKVKELADRFQFEPGPFVRSRFASPAWLTAVVLALAGWAYWARGTYAFHSPEHIAAKALDRMFELHAAQADENAVVFHSYNWGGYVTWHGWPRVKNWIDDRNEVQGRERIEENFRTVAAEPGWESVLDRYRVQFVCVEPWTPLAGAL